MAEGTQRTTIPKTEKKNLSIGCSSVGKNELLLDINEEIWEPKVQCCIYKVPKHLRDLNKEAYTPQVVSIGPFHHGKDELVSMEKHKMRYAISFCERIGLEKWKLLETFVKNNKEIIFNCYDDNLEFKSLEFEKMVLVDAVFIIEFLLRHYAKDYGDFLQNRGWLKSAIVRDFMLLENQLPYFLLEALYKIAFGYLFGNLPPFLALCLESIQFPFIELKIENLEVLHIQNFTDLLRHACLKFQVLKDKPTKCLDVTLPSAVKLNESGLKFQPIKKKSLLDINFEKRKRLIPLFKVSELRISPFTIEDKSECYIRNLMALEQCHYPNHTQFCNFIDLLDNLIDTKEDVELLVENKILNNFVGDPEALARMINKLMLNIQVSNSSFIGVADNLIEHYRNRWNRAKATLVNVYFCNPWRATSTIAAAILLLLTLVQTICSVIQVINP